jgi:uncharacterized lipoprotein YajG
MNKVMELVKGSGMLLFALVLLAGCGGRSDKEIQKDTEEALRAEAALAGVTAELKGRNGSAGRHL